MRLRSESGLAIVCREMLNVREGKRVVVAIEKGWMVKCVRNVKEKVSGKQEWKMEGKNWTSSGGREVKISGITLYRLERIGESSSISDLVLHEF